jgi:hypothetical protein
VVGEEHHQGILQDVFGFQLREDGADALVDDFDATFIGIPVAAAQRVIGIIRRELDGGQGGLIVLRGNGEWPMRFRDLELGEEGTAGGVAGATTAGAAACLASACRLAWAACRAATSFLTATNDMKSMSSILPNSSCCRPPFLERKPTMSILLSLSFLPPLM